MRKHIIRYEKLELVRTAAPQSALQAIEDVMLFDARCLDRETWRQLLQMWPGCCLLARIESGTAPCQV